MLPECVARKKTTMTNDPIVSAADALARLWKAAQLRRTLGYVGPVLPVLAEAVGLGGTGQVLLAVMLRLAERALDDPDENTEPPAEHWPGSHA